MAGVFVSYRASDEVPAEQLATELRARGHQVRFDLWDMKVGDSVVGLLNDGLFACTHLVLCFSAKGWSGRWMNREWMSALARQLEGAGVKVLPVRLTGGDPPAILADIKYADLVRDWDVGVGELCAALV